MIKVLNLYAGIGGNRKLWENVDVTAVEINPEIAKIYQDFFPNDKMIIGDAHEYLEEHFEEFDFIWSSPPCQSHSRIRNIAGVGSGNVKPIYPDMKLWAEIIFLNHVFQTSGTKFKGKYAIENVRSYYKPLIIPQERGMHYFWSNFWINDFDTKTRGHNEGITGLEKIKGFDLSDYNNDNLEQILRNCVEPELGLHVFNCAFRQKQLELI